MTKNKPESNELNTDPLDDAVNTALDLEAAGDPAGARRVLEAAANRYPEALARVAALRAAGAEMRSPLAHTDLTSRVLDQWEREVLLTGPNTTDSDGTAEPVGADTELVLAEDSAWPTAPEGMAAGMRASHARHRRPRGRRMREWTTFLAVALGLAVGVGLYIRNTPAPAPRSGGTQTPHLLQGVPPVALEAPHAEAPLRLGNAGAYDRVASSGPVISGTARLRYTRTPEAGWVFTSLPTLAHPSRPEPVLAGTADGADGLTDPVPLLVESTLQRARLRFSSDPGLEVMPR